MKSVGTNDYSERIEYAVTKSQANSTVEHVEVFLGSNLLLTIRAAVGKILESKVIQDTGLGIHIITKDHGIGFSSTCELSNPAILDTIEEALSLARYRKVNPKYTFPAPEKAVKRNLFFDEYLVEAILDYHDINDKINQMLQETMDLHPVIQEVGGPTHLVQFHKHIMNSNGLDIAEVGTYWTTELVAIAKSLTDSRDGSEPAAGWRLADLKTSSLAHHAADMAITTLDGKKVEPGIYELILSPVSVATFLQGLTLLVLPQTQEKQMTVLRDHIDKHIASPLVTIGNDPLKVLCPVAGAYDDEGTPTQNLTFIKDGIFKTMPLDTIYAHQFATISSGNGYRMGTPTDWLPGMTVYPGQLYHREPFPGLPAIYMEGGKVNTEGMIVETRKGIYLDFLDYAYVTNGGTGDYSGILRQGTFLIEYGKIKHPLRKCRLLDNIIQMAKNIELVGPSRMAGHWVTMMNVPPVKISQVQVTPY